MNHGTAVIIAKEFREGGYQARTDGHKILVDADKFDVEMFLKECHPTIKFIVSSLSNNQTEIMVLL